jgi:hypothetical protein
MLLHSSLNGAPRTILKFLQKYGCFVVVASTRAARQAVNKLSNYIKAFDAKYSEQIRTKRLALKACL